VEYRAACAYQVAQKTTALENAESEDQKDRGTVLEYRIHTPGRHMPARLTHVPLPEKQWPGSCNPAAIYTFTFQAVSHEIRALGRSSHAAPLHVMCAAGGAAATPVSSKTRATPPRLLPGAALGVPAAPRRGNRCSSTDDCQAGYRFGLQQTATDTRPIRIINTSELSCPE